MYESEFIFCSVEYGFGSETYNFSEKVVLVDNMTGKVIKSNYFSRLWRHILYKLPFIGSMVISNNVYFGNGYEELARFNKNTQVGNRLLSGE